jgi:hypothetical protein
VSLLEQMCTASPASSTSSRRGYHVVVFIEGLRGPCRTSHMTHPATQVQS